MRITRFEAENFKRLKAVDITPDGTTVVIAGRNAQGKTSVLDGIMAALAGRNGSKELVRPIRDGETKAHVTLELDDLVVERRWTPSGSEVRVSPKGGAAKLNSPQKVLDALIGSLSFDPLAFAEADAKSQIETLIDLIGREEFDRIAAERKSAYDARTEANREAKAAQARLGGLPDVEPTTRVDASRLSIELEAAIELERARAEFERIENQITELRAQQARISKAGKDVVAKVNPREASLIREEIATADARNRAADVWEKSQELASEVAGAQTESERQTTEIERLDDERRRLIAEAKLPIDGLGFDDEGVLYNGVPFVQSSAAERLKVSVAMAMALNPELRVICIRDASLLDSDSKNALVALATEHDYQIWYEVVGDGGSVGVVIEDGQVQA